jgi:hypothetical protein
MQSLMKGGIGHPNTAANVRLSGSARWPWMGKRTPVFRRCQYPWFGASGGLRVRQRKQPSLDRSPGSPSLASRVTGPKQCFDSFRPRPGRFVEPEVLIGRSGTSKKQKAPQGGLGRAYVDGTMAKRPERIVRPFPGPHPYGACLRQSKFAPGKFVEPEVLIGRSGTSKKRRAPRGGLSGLVARPRGLLRDYVPCPPGSGASHRNGLARQSGLGSNRPIYTVRGSNPLGEIEPSKPERPREGAFLV